MDGVYNFSSELGHKDVFCALGRCVGDCSCGVWPESCAGGHSLLSKKVGTKLGAALPLASLGKTSTFLRGLPSSAPSPPSFIFVAAHQLSRAIATKIHNERKKQSVILRRFHTHIFQSRLFFLRKFFAFLWCATLVVLDLTISFTFFIFVFVEVLPDLLLLWVLLLPLCLVHVPSSR